jgi:hypothetical protein
VLTRSPSKAYGVPCSTPPLWTRSYNVLRIGRIGLYFQSEDAGITGRWDNEERKWVEDNSARNEVRTGLRMAEQLIAPEVIVVPVSAPTPAEAS